MNNIYTCSGEEFLANSKIPVRVLPDYDTAQEEIAEIMASTIEAAKGGRCFMICPVGPVDQYPLLAKKINERRLNLKNVWIVNMDEYLTDDDRPVPPDSSLSFVGFMNRVFYSQIDPELVMPVEQRIFPMPGHEAEIDALIEKLGPADCCLTGVGINGHIAFNEPALETDEITDEEFAALGTRCLDIARDTIVNNGARKVYGALDLMPKRCVTLGMKQLLASKMFKVYLYLPWQWGIMRKIAPGEVTRFAPASFLQNHPDAEMVITKDLLELTL